MRDKGGPVADVMTTIHGQMFADEDYSETAVDEFCDGIDDLWQWWTAAESARKATLMVKKAVSRAIIRALKGDAIRLDESFVCGMPTTTTKVIDPDGLSNYLELSAGAKAAMGNDINIKGIRAYAESKGDDPDAIEQQFFSTEIDEYQPPWLKVTQMEWAPRWFIEAKPPHGGRVRPPDRRERKAS